MSYYRGPAYPPRKRARGGVFNQEMANVDFYDGGERYSRPRESLEESVLTRLRKDFISLANPNPQSTTADDIDYLAKSLVSEYQKATTVKAGIHELLYHCVLELSSKIPHYASLFVLANSRKQVVGKDILEFTVSKVKELLEKGEMLKAKLMLRFLAGLARIVDEDGVTKVIEEIVSKFEGQGANARLDSLAKLVLLTLPYIAASPKKPSAALDAIVDRMTAYMDLRDRDETAFIKPFKAASTDPLGDYSCLHLLWLQTLTLKENDWDIPFLPRPWFAFRTELESNTKTHPIPEFSLTFDPETIPPLKPEYYFSIFLNNEKQTVPKLENIASILLRDVITDTMHQLVFNRKEAAHYLIDLPQYFPTGLFHRPGLAIKDLPTPNPARPKFKLEDIIVDSVFAALFTLPTPQEREMFYAALLTEITKLAPQDIAPTLGRAIRWVYGRLDDVVGELDMRFSSWFAIHLSNFGFTYKWDEWVGDLSLEEGMPKKVFLRETLEKEVRLSYLERIQRTLPEEYFAVFPEKAGVDEWKIIAGILQVNITNLERFGGDEDEKFIELLRAKDDSAIAAYFDEHPSSGELLVAGLLSISHETPYSHTISPATLDLIKKYTTPSSLISTIMSFWRDRPSTGTVLVIKYVDLRIISLADVISWLLEQDSWMHKSWGWEIIQICSEKADGRISRQFKPQVKSIETNSDDKEMTDAKPAEVGSEENAADAMQLDAQNGVANGYDTHKERRQMFEKIVEGVGACYERQSERDRDWLKEWFAMVVRKYGEDVASLEATGWAGEILAAWKEYRVRSG